MHPGLLGPAAETTLIALLLACVVPSSQGATLPKISAPVLLGGQASLSVDHWRQSATLRVQTFRAQPAPLPEDRQGIAMGECASIVPTTTGEGMVFEAEQVSAMCPGHTLTLEDQHSGASIWRLDPMPEAGLVCTIAIGGVSAQLPPLPAAPALDQDGRKLSWTPTGADEVRLVSLNSIEESGVCRLPDLGSAKLPFSMRRGTLLVTWHSARLTQVNKRPMSLSATAGTWLLDEN